MLRLSALDELHNIIGHVLRVVLAVPDSAGRTPRENVGHDLRVSRFGFLYEPPFVTAGAVLVRAAVHLAGFGAVFRIEEQMRSLA